MTLALTRSSPAGGRRADRVRVASAAVTCDDGIGAVAGLLGDYRAIYGDGAGDHC